MEIKLSRHAKRRAKLYEIPEAVIRAILAELDLDEGKHEIVRKVPGLIYPLKTVVAVEGNTVTVITAYPLKRGKKQ